MTPSVPFASPSAQVRALEPHLRSAIDAVLGGEHFILGPQVQALEAEFSGYLGTSHAIGVANGTEAIALVLTALGIGPGDEVVTVAHTALATIAGITLAGATPVLVDVDPSTLLIDATRIAAALSPRTRAVLPVHLYGRAVDLEPIAELCTRHGLALIEDGSQAHGALLASGRRAGTRGVAGVFSCYPTKNLGALGDAGLIATEDPALAARLARLRQYGWDDDQVSRAPGWNSRLDELQAAVLRVKLTALDAGNDRRQAIAARYDAALAGLDLELPAPALPGGHVQHLYVVQADDRDGLQEHLSRQGIATGVHYPRGAHQHPGYAPLCRFDELPVTERAAGRVLSLPMFPELTDAQVDRVIEAVRTAR